MSPENSEATLVMSETLPENSDTQGVALIAGLRAARAALGWSQAELAMVAGVAKVTIARMEAGMMSPRLSTITRLQAAMEREGIRLTLNEPQGGFTLSVLGAALQAPNASRGVSGDRSPNGGSGIRAGRLR